KKMTVTGVPETLPDLVTRTTTLAKAAEEFVIPDPSYATILSTEATATNEGATWQVLKMDLDLGQAHILIETTYKDLGGKWGVETTTIQYPQYKKVIKYE